MQRRHLLSLPALLAPAIMAAPGIAHAQDGAWPGRQPIRLIAGFPAGGLADAIGRLFAAPRSPAPMGEEFSRFVAGFRDHWVAMARAQGIVAS